MAIKCGWKVVRVLENGEMRSVWGLNYGSSADLLYAPGQWTTPLEGDGPLAVFDDLQLATKFYETDTPLINNMNDDYRWIKSVLLLPCLYEPAPIEIIFITSRFG